MIGTEVLMFWYLMVFSVEACCVLLKDIPPSYETV
jgi:hypothetical protein